MPYRAQARSYVREFSHRRERAALIQALAWAGQHASMISSTSAGHRALRRGRRSLENCCYLLTVTTCQRRRVFDDFELASSACRAFIAALPPDATLLAWVLMPDHVHWLVQLGDMTPLARTVSCMKAASTRAVNRQREMPGAVWARAYHDCGLRKEYDLRIVARYLIANPLRAGLVERVGDYPFWDAIWLP